MSAEKSETFIDMSFISLSDYRIALFIFVSFVFLYLLYSFKLYLFANVCTSNKQIKYYFGNRAKIINHHFNLQYIQEISVIKQKHLIN